MRVWIDTDVGGNPDDAVALLTARAHPEITLVGVSTVHGDTAARAGIARRLVDPVPVVAGTEGIVQTFEEAHADALVGVGPLTNIASLVDGGVDLPERIVLMGGVLDPVSHRGSLRDIETNFGADPAATRLVLDWTDATIVPLDVTVGMGLTDAERDRLTSAHPELDDAAPDWAEPWVLHDPLALLGAIHDVEVSIETRSLSADAQGRVVERAGARQHPVVVDADTTAAKRRVLELLDA